MKNFWNDFVILLAKNAALLIGVSSTMAAKIIIDSRVKKLTWKEIFGKIIIGGACGWVTCSYLLAHNMHETTKWAVPMATMIGESFLIFLTQNVYALYKFLAKKWLGMKDDDFRNQ